MASSAPQLSTAMQSEPLVRMSDWEEYREGLKHYQAKEWDDERWTAFRTRFGIYGQIQPGVQMIRIKIPGGVLPLPWLRTVADVNRRFAKGDAHITTRQDFQIYHIPLADTADTLEALYGQGLTSREACGNTVRNITACPLSGSCPHERVDAGAVADSLARAWLRHPLSQHMPRKIKFSVSGCGVDCSSAVMHDLGFVAVKKDGRNGFKVSVGGGLGAAPMPAVVVADFVTEDELSMVVEAVLRLHQRYSNRRNRNAARIKFIVHRFGEERFRELFEEEMARLRPLPQRPWTPLTWRQPDEEDPTEAPFGVFTQPDGRKAIVAHPPLGLVSSEVMDRLADLAAANGLSALRTTRGQSVVFPDLDAAAVPAVLAELRALGLEVEEEKGSTPDVISCPGTTTCRIGITASQPFGAEVVERLRDRANGRGISVRISGCQNACGQHHIGDFGFHGMGKKINGVPAPHYQIHLGGSAKYIGLSGPIVPARLAPQALELMIDAYADSRRGEETVRDWAQRLGKAGIDQVLAPLATARPDGGDLFVDWGKAATFAPPPPAKGDCAAMFATDDLLADLADDALITMDRSLYRGLADAAREAGRQAVLFAARRLLLVRQADLPGDASPEDVLAQVRAVHDEDREIGAALGDASALFGSGEIALDEAREDIAAWLDLVRDRMAAADALLSVAAE